MFNGVYAALFTPFDKKEEICEKCLREHTEFLIEKGLHGLYVCGNSGQGLYMSVDERKHVLEIVKDQAKGRVTLIAHVACMITKDAEELVSHANELKVDGIASLPPIYWPYTSDEIVKYYQDINSNNDLPCFIYHIPRLAGGGISMETMLRLGEIPQIQGLKYTDADFFALQALLQKMKGKWIAFSGPDQLFLPALCMGVIGSIGSTQNIFPELFVSIYNDFLEGNIDKARETQSIVTRILSTRNTYGMLTASKTLLKLRGLKPGCLRRPMTPYLEKEEIPLLLNDIRKILEEGGWGRKVL
jgi:N-acetylneuraminate lyase